MRKLKLETLQVESFETTAAAPRERGTVEAHAGGPPSIETYSPKRCGDTMYFDCTLGCSINTACPNGCIEA